MSICQYCMQSHSQDVICAENPNNYDQPEQASVDKDDLIDLVMYADAAARILEENGYSGKAEALKSRYMKFSYLIK